MAEPAPFTVYPAIDLRGGRVVRLVQGDPARQTVYGDDPAAVARRWQAEGAEWLHVVNLDGAFGEANGPNAAALQAVVAVGPKVQFGGGLRDRAALERVLGLGVARAVLGTAAVEQPALVAEAVQAFGPEAVAVGIDARAGRVRVRGWVGDGGVDATALALQMRGLGLRWCVFTDVARDGVGAGVNVAATQALAEASGLRVIASGGVAGPDDVARVRAAGLPGVIVGRALYEGQVQLKDVLNDRHR
ncbi:MAG: 1-(5-phosphoribosyl)-5-[(5-phosphoribosylamino)methylideneamino]imidazole-4-carboxamide isomerase [Anaerolineales bacterium]|nr:1-(5-phosphoribosyl)-5-[(5-phosphoribosylamino)methylideneamino]imidazole-4-carboxamide isomerase [Anaerolineales bacterium]